MKLTKILCVIIVFIALIIFAGCSKEQTCTVTEKDGVKTYRNKNIPTVEKLDFNPVKKFTLNSDTNDVNYLSFFDIDVVGLDSEENIYIADFAVPRVNKYDKNGKFVTSFVKQGSGPGEVDKITFICVKNDTIYIGDQGTQSVSIFNTSGEFLHKIRPEGYRYSVLPLDKNKFLCTILSIDEIDAKEPYRKELTILNNSFEPLKTLNRMNYSPEESRLPDMWDYVYATEDKIYVGVNDKIFYKVNVFDHNGNLIEVVNKNYAAISFSDQEYDKMDKYVKKLGEPRLNKNRFNKKRAVVGVYNDKNGNLIVQPAVDTSIANTERIVFDFFKDNVYMNSSFLKTDKPYYQCDFNIFLKFYGNRIMVIDSDKNTVDVFEY
ncbi:TPA: hypothetical protein DCR49_05415 [Candidatus Delongbacteria bacterium]|nr:hypothetical protein [Candidatus Delongbacteria bacterium]